MSDIEWAKLWVNKLTISLPDISERERAHSLLRDYFDDLRQADLIPQFLALAASASSRQQRILADIVASVMHPGEGWLAALKEHRRDYCRRLARTCTKVWSEPLVSGALLQGIEKALQDEDDERLTWIMRLTLETAKERPAVSLRAVERFLARKSQPPRGWRRKKSLMELQTKAFHTALLEVMAPADTPLTAIAPRIDKGLPLPAEAGQSTADNLPLPSEGTTAIYKPGFWQLLFNRLRRSTR
ncbi:MAG: hypothetical protein QM758_28010 [Armatimonas sp.]